MRANRAYFLLCLMALLFTRPTGLGAADDPKGQYEGTIQTRQINEAYLLRRGLDAIANQPPDPTGANLDPARRAQLDKENKQIATEIQQHRNQSDVEQLKQAKVTDVNPFVMMIADGAVRGQYSLELGPASANYMKLTVPNSWNATPDNRLGVIQASWRKDGFELVRTQGAQVYRIAGKYNGPQVSGEWSVSENGTQTLAGVFNVSKKGSGGGSGSGSRGNSSPPPKAVGMDGEYNGTVSSADANTASGHIQFTVGGNSLHGTVGGEWSGLFDESVEQKQREGGSYSGTFSGSVDPDSGSFTTSMAGKIGDFDFTGHIRGRIQGNSARGTWDAANDFGKSSGTWSASRPAPVVPVPGSTNQGTDIIESAPPGITNVGDVPGPADLPETGTGVLLPGVIAAATVGIKAMLDSRVTPPPLVDYGPSGPDTGPTDGPDGSDGSTPQPDSAPDSTPTAAPADQSSASSPQPAPPAPDYGPDHAQAIRDWQDSSDKYDSMKKQLADFEQGVDKTDPRYDALKKQYTDYLDYYKQKADNSSAQADAIAQAAELERNTRVLKDFQGNDVKQVVYDPTTGQWHDRETGNLFDPDKWQQTQEQAAKDAAWSHADLQKMGDRQDSFSKHMDEVVRKEKSDEAKLDYLSKLNRVAWNNNLTDPGAVRDVFTSTQKMMDDILDGKPVNVPNILDARRYLHDRLLGTVAPESILSLPQNQANMGDIATEAALGSVRELITGRDADGHFTVAGVIGSIGLHIAVAAVAGPTAAAYLGPGREWATEAALTAVNTLYAEHDAIARGSTGWQALGSGALEGLMQGGVQGVGGVLLHHVPVTFPNLANGIGEMMQPVSQLGKRISNAMFPLSEDLQATRSAVDRVLASNDQAELARLYSNGGMARLGELQASGNLSVAEASALNARLAPIVNQEIDSSTRLAIQQFQSRTGVKVEQSIIADSGSSARQGANPKAYTDFDRTHVTRFKQDDLEQYALDHSLSVEEANQKLQNLYGNQLTDNLDTRLRDAGFSQGKKDVNYNTYHGIGTDSGPVDAYGAGWTGQRTKLQGTANEYNTNAAGNIRSVRQITGTAVVDQHGLNVAQVTHELPPNPDKFSPGEFQLFSKQQVEAVNGHLDVKSVAKAMGRESDLATRVSSMSGNDAYRAQLRSAGIPEETPVLSERLTGIAKEINARPSQADAILAQNHLTPTQFQNQVSAEIERYHTGIGGTVDSGLGAPPRS